MCEFHKTILVALKLKNIENYPVDTQGKVIVPWVGPCVRSVEDDSVKKVICSCRLSDLIKLLDTQVVEYEVIDGDKELKDELEAVINHKPSLACSKCKYRLFVFSSDLGKELGRLTFKHVKMDDSGNPISAYAQDYGMFDFTKFMMQRAMEVKTDDPQKVICVHKKLLRDHIPHTVIKYDEPEEAKFGGFYINNHGEIVLPHKTSNDLFKVSPYGVITRNTSTEHGTIENIEDYLVEPKKN